MVDNSVVSPQTSLPNELIQAFWFTWGVEGWTRHEDAITISQRALAMDVTGDLVEIGCWKGKFSIVLAAVTKIRGRSERLICIDPFVGWNYVQDGYQPPPPGHPLSKPTYEHFAANLARSGLEDNVEVVRDTSENALPTLKNRKFSLVFLDGDHTYKGVKADVDGCLPLLVTGGYLILDDVKNAATPGPGRVNSELKLRGDCVHIYENDKISIFQKKAL